MIHNPLDIADKVSKAGWAHKDKRIIAVAVCWAESRFNDQAFHENKNDAGEVTSIDRGLFQINSKFQPQVTETCAFDPDCNIKAAFEIYKKNGFSFKPWAAYNNGSYKTYLPEATIAVEADIRINALERDLADAIAAGAVLDKQLETCKSNLATAVALSNDLSASVETLNQRLTESELEVALAKEERAQIIRNLDSWLLDLRNQIVPPVG